MNTLLYSADGDGLLEARSGFVAIARTWLMPGPVRAQAMFWTFTALVFLPQTSIPTFSEVHPPATALFLASHFLIFAWWFVAAPFALAFAELVPCGGRHGGPSRILAHVAMCIAAVTIHLLFTAASHHLLLFAEGASFGERLKDYAISMPPVDVLIYCGIVIAANAALSARRAEENKRREMQASLETLRQQLNPHFLFNMLNVIAELVHRNPDLADSLITRLSVLLRRSLDRLHCERVPLHEEVSFLRAYLDLQHAADGGRIETTFEISTEAVEALLPPMSLQPLVENVIKHAVSSRAGAIRIVIEATRQADTLVLKVEDDGAQRAGRAEERVGLANLRARLDALYGTAATLHLGTSRWGGFLAMIILPLRRNEGSRS